MCNKNKTHADNEETDVHVHVHVHIRGHKTINYNIGDAVKFILRVDPESVVVLLAGYFAYFVIRCFSGRANMKDLMLRY